jgi:hypothetical protein
MGVETGVKVIGIVLVAIHGLVHQSSLLLERERAFFAGRANTHGESLTISYIESMLLSLTERNMDV